MDLNTIGATKGSWLKLATVAKSPGQLRVIQTSSFANGTIRADAIRVQLVGQDAQDHSRVAYVHADHLGTPLAMSDKNQRVIWRAEYEPFGAAIANTDPDADGQNVTMNLRFPGQYFDAESGLHYNYFRDYDPDLGRYIESDPIGLIAGVNTYAYVNGNPLAQVDSLGLWASQKTRYVHQWAWQNTVGRGQNLGVNMVVEHALAFADAPQFQDKAHSHQHAMRNDPNQSVAAGATATADFVRSQYDRAWNLLEAGNKSAALHEFGLALHALQDATSPAHEGFQVWTGEETRWEVVQHVRQEIHDPGPGSALYEITEEAWNALNERRYPDKPW
jgi:RHS repeat-associated protein